MSRIIWEICIGSLTWQKAWIFHNLYKVASLQNILLRLNAIILMTIKLWTQENPQKYLLGSKSMMIILDSLIFWNRSSKAQHKNYQLLRNNDGLNSLNQGFERDLPRFRPETLEEISESDEAWEIKVVSNKSKYIYFISYWIGEKLSQGLSNLSSLQRHFPPSEDDYSCESDGSHESFIDIKPSVSLIYNTPTAQTSSPKKIKLLGLMNSQSNIQESDTNSIIQNPNVDIIDLSNYSADLDEYAVAQVSH